MNIFDLIYNYSIEKLLNNKEGDKFIFKLSGDWWRWGPPLVLISLKNIIERLKIPTSDRLRRVSNTKLFYSFMIIYIYNQIKYF